MANAPLTTERPEVAAAPALWVRWLRLTNVRTYTDAELRCDGRCVVLTGSNGAGKTNMLEAVSFLAPGRGLRRARLSEVERMAPADGETAPAAGWGVAAEVETPDGPREIGTGREPGGRERRAVRIDGQPAGGQQALGELVAATWLTPQMDRLFQDGPAARRRFLDRLVFGLDPAHATRVNRYEHALRERARILRGEGTADPAWLDALERRMAEQGVAIAAARRHLVDRLAGHAAHDPGPFPRAGLDLTGDVEEWLAETSALAAEDRLTEALAASRARDGETGGAAHGPHRGDLAARHLERGQPAALCSTGEQKALLVAIVLAHARLLTAERGFAPLVLLDEVAAHLDAPRRDALFTELPRLGAQAWLTGTDPALFDGLRGHAQLLTVEAGRIRPLA